MRLRTMLLTTGLALVALSLPPAGAEAVPDGCPPATVPLVQGTVALRSDCTVSLEVNMTCAPPSHTTVERDLPGGHHVRLSVCDGGVEPGSVIGPVAVGAAQPGCRPGSTEAEGPFGTNRVEVAHDCRATVTLNEGVICLGGSVERTELDALGHTVIAYGCGDPNQGGGLGDPIATSAAAPGCSPWDTHAETVLGGLYVEQEHNCRVLVSLDSGCDGPTTLDVSGNTVTACGPAVGGAQASSCPEDVDGPGSLGVVFDDDCVPHPTAYVSTECLGGSDSRKTVYDDGYVHVSYSRCDNGLPPVSAASSQEPDVRPAECPGVATAYPVYHYVDVTVRSWGCQVRVTTLGGVDCPDGLDGSTSTSRGSVTLTAHCTPSAAVPAAAAAPSCEKVPSPGSGVTVRDDCAVYLRFIECIWGGSYEPVVEAGPVRVYNYRCGPPYPPTSTASASASAAPCSAVPGAGGVTVSDDCLTVSNKLYDCVWGGYWYELRAGPVTYREYRCGPPYETSATTAGPCGPLGILGPSGAVHLRVRDDCTAEVGVLDDVICVGGWATRVERDVAGSTVRATVCDGGLGQRLGDLVTLTGPSAGTSMADPFPTCITEPCGPVPPGPVAPCSTVAGSGAGSQGQLRYAYEVDAGCNVDATVHDCLWDRYWGTLFLGPATVTLRDCGPADG